MPSVRRSWLHATLTGLVAPGGDRSLPASGAPNKSKRAAPIRETPMLNKRPRNSSTHRGELSIRSRLASSTLAAIGVDFRKTLRDAELGVLVAELLRLYHQLGVGDVSYSAQGRTWCTPRPSASHTPLSAPDFDVPALQGPRSSYPQKLGRRPHQKEGTEISLSRSERFLREPATPPKSSSSLASFIASTPPTTTGLMSNTLNSAEFAMLQARCTSGSVS